MIKLLPLFLLLSTPALATSNLDPDSGLLAPSEVVPVNVHAEDGWSPPTLQGSAVGVVYMTLHNAGSTEVTVTGAATEQAGHVEFHNHRTDAAGVMKMEQLDALHIPPHGELKLVPGGLHLMLMELKQPLAADDVYTVTLRYGNGASLPVEVQVMRPEERKERMIDATNPGEMPSSEHHHHH